MFRKYLWISIISLFFIFASRCQAEFSFSPFLSIGAFSNDNFELVPSSARYESGTELESGFYISSYLSPDLMLFSSYTMPDNSVERDYGGSLEMAYDLNERLKMKVAFGDTYYEDRLNDGNNYRTKYTMPIIFFKFNPFTNLSLNQTNSAYSYIRSGEKTFDHKDSASIYQQLTDALAISIGGSRTQGQADISSNYTTVGSQVGLFIDFSAYSQLSVYSINEHIIYPFWVPKRIDRKITVFVDYEQSIAADWAFNLEYSKVNNISNIGMQDYVNNIASFGLSWSPVFGKPYPNNAQNSIEFYFTEGRNAMEREDWGAMEKQFRKIAFYYDDLSDVYFYLGYSLSKQRKYWDSIEYFKKVIDLEPTYAEAYYLLAFAYLNTGQKDEAYEILVKLWKFHKDPEVKMLILELVQ